MSLGLLLYRSLAKQLQQQKQWNSMMIGVLFMVPFSLVFYLLRIGFMAALVAAK
jgi:hypothetical protein